MDLGLSPVGPRLCFRCGGVLRKTADDPESYECECGYAIRRVSGEKAEHSLLAFDEIGLSAGKGLRSSLQ